MKTLVKILVWLIRRKPSSAPKLVPRPTAPRRPAESKDELMLRLLKSAELTALFNRGIAAGMSPVENHVFQSRMWAWYVVSFPELREIGPIGHARVREAFEAAWRNGDARHVEEEVPF